MIMNLQNNFRIQQHIKKSLTNTKEYKGQIDIEVLTQLRACLEIKLGYL